MRGIIDKIHTIHTGKKHLIITVINDRGDMAVLRISEGQKLNFSCDDKLVIQKINKLGETTNLPMKGIL